MTTLHGDGRMQSGAAASPATSASAAAPWPRLCLVGPMPPPAGGMANQCEQLLRLLAASGAQVAVVRTNAPYWPAWLGRVPVVRAGGRLIGHLLRSWRALRGAQVVHVLANSGWSWHLSAAPVLWMARWRGVPVVLNYRGGAADEFLARAPRHVHQALARCEVRVTPSAFLQRVFAKHGLQARIIPNIVDLSRFRPASRPPPGDAPHFVVTRHLEAIYRIDTAVRAFALLRRSLPQARLSVAGSGPEAASLKALAQALGVAHAVDFMGNVGNAQMPVLYAQADCMLNPSSVDNMPISILEALASGVPIVTTDAGGIPDMVEHDRTALLVPVGDAEAMAAAALRLLHDEPLRRALVAQGLQAAQAYAWAEVGRRWQSAYRDAVAAGADRVAA